VNVTPSNYNAEGYCVYTGVLNAEEISAVRIELDAILANLPARQVVYKDGEHQEVDARPEYLTEPHPKPIYQRKNKVCESCTEVLSRQSIHSNLISDYLFS